MVITTLAAGAEALDKTGKVISALEKIMPWILIQPPAAAAELASVINEVMKAPNAANHATDALLILIDEEKPKLDALAQVGDGTLLNDVEALRPHCHQIRTIAKRHLSQWFSRPNDPDVRKLTDILEELGEADDVFFKGFVDFAKQIISVADAAANLAIRGEKAEALALLASAAPTLFATRKQANELALQLTLMQTKFRRRALGLPPE